RVWGYGEPEHDEIRGLQGSIQYILGTIEEKGPFSGITGFSSGAAMTAIITPLLEKNDGISGFPLKVNHPKLRFAICLSGFKLENMCYEAFYSPKIATPTFHTIGLSDATISPDQTKRLARQCKSPWLYQYNGGWVNRERRSQEYEIYSGSDYTQY
ncbi:serine hydrolase-domain-containing protein, partial [Penicillium diatomitis]